MSIHFHGTFKDGVIHPDQPLGLPEEAKVEVYVTPVDVPADVNVPSADDAEFDVEAFRERIRKNAVSVGTLPPDFSRADIYSDHD